MSHQAAGWARHQSPMLLTPKGKPDTTAREILGELAEHADEFGRNTWPSVLHIRWATGYDERTIQRALLRLERAKLIARVGITREGCVKWQLDMSQVRPESDWTDLEAEADKLKRMESERRAARRAKSRTTDESRDAESRRPARRIPASGTQSADVRDGTPPEPSVEPPLNHQGISTGGTLPPDPLRPDDPSGHRTDSEISLSDGGDQPPQPDTATHDRTRDFSDEGQLPLASPEQLPTEPPVPLLRLVPAERPPVGSRRWSSRGQDVIAEATTRRAARIAANQQNAGETA